MELEVHVHQVLALIFTTPYKRRSMRCMDARAGVCAMRQHGVVTLEHFGCPRELADVSGIARLHHQPRRPCGRWWLDGGQLPWPHPQ